MKVLKRGFRVLAFMSATAVLAVGYNNCSGGFAVATRDGSSLGNVDLGDASLGKVVYDSKCLSCHGALETSAVKDKPSDRIRWAIDNVGAMSGLRQLSMNDILNVTAALSGSNSPSLNGRSSFACSVKTNPPKPIDTMQRLSNREIKSSLVAVLGEMNAAWKTDATLLSLLTALPSDSIESKENTILLTSTWVGGFSEVAFRAAQIMGTNLSVLPGATAGCMAVATPTAACVQGFLKEIGLRITRRPVDSVSLASLTALYGDAGASSTADRIFLVASALFQSPDFLYRIYDGGTPITGATSILAMSSYDYASKLSYSITGAPPDATLRSLAASGAILNHDTAVAQIDRLLATADAESTIIRFYREWLHYNQYDSFSYSAAFLNGVNTSGLPEAMTSELDKFFVDVTLKSGGSYKDLMTSTSSNFSSDALATIYGVGNPRGSTSLSPSQRPGFLTRAAMLTKRSGSNTSPIRRGLAVLEDVLCETVGAPPPNAPVALNPLPQGTYLTTRARTAGTTEQSGSSCLGCHSRMNPLGYTLEIFDSLGRMRTAEKLFAADGTFTGLSLPIDPTASTSSLTSASTPLRDGIDLASQLSNNDKAIQCFVRKWYSFELRRAVGTDDYCHMNTSLGTLYGAQGRQGSFSQMIKERLLADAFKQWKYGN